MKTLLLSLLLLVQSPQLPQQPAQKTVWIKLRSGETITGQLVKIDPTGVDFTVRGILQSIPCNDVSGVFFEKGVSQPTPEQKNDVAPKLARKRAIEKQPIEEESPGLKPILLYKEIPAYTEKARVEKIEGAVILQAVFYANGVIDQIRVIKELPHGLTENAIAAARKIRFIPALRDGQYVNVRGKLEFTFVLQ